MDLTLSLKNIIQPLVDIFNRPLYDSESAKHTLLGEVNTEILSLVLSCLHPQERIQKELVCRKWRQLIQETDCYSVQNRETGEEEWKGYYIELGKYFNFQYAPISRLSCKKQYFQYINDANFIGDFINWQYNGNQKLANDALSNLLRRGVNPNVLSTNGFSPLHMAVISQDKERIDQFIQWGGNIQRLDKEKNSVLQLFLSRKIVQDKIAEGKHEKTLLNFLHYLIVKHKIPVNHCNINRKTALDFARTLNWENGIKLLLKHKANPNLLDDYGRNQLHCSILEGKPHLVRLFILGGADMKMTTQGIYKKKYFDLIESYEDDDCCTRSKLAAAFREAYKIKYKEEYSDNECVIS